MATLRPEFLDRLLRDPDLARLPIATQMVRPLRRETLRSVIEGPCRLAGLMVSEELVSSLIDDTEGGEALPLLAFTLSELGDGLARGEELSIDRYRSLGGVRGALIRQADAALADAMAATGRSQAAVIATLLRLVTVDEQGRPTRWQVTRTDLPDDVSAELDCFVNRRLLTIDTIAGDAVIGAAHEAFFTAWPPLDEAITEVASALRARRLLEDAALEWNSAERSPDRLWERGQLAAAVSATGASVRAREVVIDRVHITKQGREFLYASIRRDRFRRGRSVALLSILLALAVTAALVAVVQQQTAHRQQQVAQEQALLATSRQLIAKAEADLDTDPRTALMLNIAAHRIHPDPVSYSSLQQSLTTTPYAGELPGVDSAVSSVSYSSTGRYLAVGFASGAVMLWDMAGPAGPRLLGKPFTGFASPVNAVFDHGERRLVTASTSGTVVIWDLTDLQQPRQVGIPLTAPKDPTEQSAWLAPDGTLLATSSRAHPGVQLWDLTEPQRILPIGQRFAEQPTPILSVGFSADSKMIATGGQAGVPVQLWDLSRPAAPRQLSRITPNPSDVVRSLAFSADNKQLAVGGDLRGARLWQIEDPTTPRATAAKPSGTFFSAVIFSPRGATLATTGNRDTGLTLWDVTNPDRPQQVERLFSGDSDLHAAFSPDGHLVASGSLDGHVTLWNLNRAGRPRNLGPPFLGHQGTHKEIYTLTIANDGTMLATGGRDGSVVLWSIADPTRPRRIDTLRGTDESVDAISFAPDGSTLAIGGTNGETTLWDLTDRNHPRQLGSPIRGSSDNVVRSMVFSADGTTLTVGTDRGTTYWDVHDRTQPRRVADVLQDDGVLNIWRLPNGHVLALLRGSSDDPKPSTIAAPSIQPTRSTTGTAGGSAGSQSTGHPDNPNGSRLWDITDPAHPHQLGPALIGHTAPIATAALSAAGDLLATSDTEGTTILWDVTNPNQARRIGDSLAPHGHVSSIVAAFTPRTDLMATGGIDGNAYLWDLGNRSAPRRFGPALAENLDAITRISFTPSGQILATAGSAGDVVLWDLRPAYELRTHLDQAACLVTGRGLDRDE